MESFDGVAVGRSAAGSRGEEAYGQAVAALQGIQEDRQRRTACVPHENDGENGGDPGSAKEGHDIDCHRNDDLMEHDDAGDLGWGGLGNGTANAWVPETPALSSVGGGGSSGGGGGGASGMPPGGVGGGMFGFDFGAGVLTMDHGGGHEGAEGGSQGGGVEWVMEGGEAIAMTDEVELPLVGEIHLNLGRNFGHFFQVCKFFIRARSGGGGGGGAPVVCAR